MRTPGICALQKFMLLTGLVLCSISAIALPSDSTFRIHDSSLRLKFYDGWFRMRGPWSCDFLRYSSNVPKTLKVRVKDWGGIDPDSFELKVEFLDTLELSRSHKDYHLKKRSIEPSERAFRRCSGSSASISLDGSDRKPRYERKRNDVSFRTYWSKGFEGCTACVPPPARGRYRIQMVAINRRSGEEIRSLPAILHVR